LSQVQILESGRPSKFNSLKTFLRGFQEIHRLQVKTPGGSLTMGIYNKKQKVKNRISKITNSSDYSEENSQYFEKFYEWGRSKRDWSYHRAENYLYGLQKMIENNEFDITDLDQDKFDKILLQIQDSEYKERGAGGYSEETKADFRKALKRICEHQGKVDLLPRDQYGQIELKTGVPSEDKKKTRPDELPTIEEAKQIAQKIEEQSRGYSALRNVALFMVVYESGCRIGEALNIQMQDIKIKNEKLIEIYIPGNKQSDDRWNSFVLTAPVLKRYIQGGHPCPNEGDSYLFTNIKEEKGTQMQYRNAKKIFDQAGDAAEIESKFNPHVFRKKRISFLKSYMDMKESNIDVRVGHAPGSDTTRLYTRISDEEVRDQYQKAYGLTESEEENPEKILWPKECSSCDSLVSGHRDVCHSCGEVVNKLAFGEVEYSSEHEAELMKDTVIDMAEEFGMEREKFVEFIWSRYEDKSREGFP
jgi:integrase